MSSRDAVEIERKFDVDESTPLPRLDKLPGVLHVQDPVEYRLDATYFDTADLALANSRITLRRRTGGEDEGWHLKTLIDADQRHEYHEPLGSDAHEVPERLLRRVRVHVRDRPLAAVVHLQTTRLVRRLLDADGRVLAEFCDDRVRAERFPSGAAAEEWREWEVELVDGHPGLLDAAQTLLAESGVSLSGHVSKLSRALGELAHPLPPARPRLGRKSPAGDILLAYVAGNVRMLWAEDPRVRDDEPDAVHQFRIALRRLRSALGTFRPLLDREVADGLRTELKWMAGELGAARDLQVLHERLRALLAAEPAELVIGPITGRIDDQLDTDTRAAREGGLAALDSDRYFRLLDALDAFLLSPPLAPAASEPAVAVIPDLIELQRKRLKNRVRAAEAASGEARELALHEVRKGAKQLRYAAEASSPLGRRAATRLAAAAEEVQAILGEHHDSVVARALLLRWAGAAHSRGEDGFSYGRLHAREEAVAADADERFRAEWKRFAH
ncbi:CYTH and CHAD domain-containing protein [soil metagenome]